VRRPASEFNGPGYDNEPDSKDPRVVRLAAWLKSVNQNELADQFHTELAQIQIGEFITAGLYVSLEDWKERAEQMLEWNEYLVTQMEKNGWVLPNPPGPTPHAGTIKSTTDHGIYGSLSYRFDNSQHMT